MNIFIEEIDQNEILAELDEETPQRATVVGPDNGMTRQTVVAGQRYTEVTQNNRFSAAPDHNIFDLVVLEEHKFKNIWKKDKKRSKEDDEYSLATINDDNDEMLMNFDGDSEDDDDNENKGAKVAGNAQNDDLTTGIEVGFSKFITNEFLVSKDKKLIEERDRDIKLKHIQEQISAYQRKLLGMNDT